MTSTEQRIHAAAMRLFVEKGTTQVSISELAQRARVARGTLYRNAGSMDTLFERVVAELSDDLHRRVSHAFIGIDDPAARLAAGIRLWIRYGHENPAMGRFTVKFGLNQATLRSLMTGPPMSDIKAGIASGRYDLGDASIDSVASLVVGATISALWMVLEGHQTWREAGSSAAELVLRAMGIDATEAHPICTADLPMVPAH